MSILSPMIAGQDWDAPMGAALAGSREAGPELMPLTIFERVMRAVGLTTVQPFVIALDLSHWNQEPDFAKLYAEGVRLIILRVSYGQAGVDRKFAEWWPKALAAGIKLAVYHFGRQDVAGMTQADHMIGLVDPLFEALGYAAPIVYDMETIDGSTSTSQRWGILGSFAYRMEEIVQAKHVLLYTSPSFAQSYLQPYPAWEGKVQKWMAHWRDGPPAMVGLTNLKMQQIGICNDHPWVPCFDGIAPDVDVNHFFGTEEDLAEWAGGPVAPPPPPPDPIAEQAKSLIDGLSVRGRPDVSTGTRVGRLSKGEIVDVLNVITKSNGEIWLHIEAVDLLAGWACMYYPSYANPWLMEWI